MDIFWRTIAGYNAATWPHSRHCCRRGHRAHDAVVPSAFAAVKVAMKVYLTLLNGWIAAAYYLWACAERPLQRCDGAVLGHNGVHVIYDLAVNYTTFERTGKHDRIALVFYLMPFIYPPFSLLRGWVPDDHLAGDALLGGGLHDRADAGLFQTGEPFRDPFSLPLGAGGFLEGLFFGIPRICCWSALRSRRCTSFSEYIRDNAGIHETSPRVLNALLAVMCLIIGCFFAFTLLHQLNSSPTADTPHTRKKKRRANRTLFFAADTAYSLRRRSHLLLAPMTASTRSSP